MFVNGFVNAQTETNITKLLEIANKSKSKAIIQKEEAILFATQNNLDLKKVLEDGTEIELIAMKNGMPLYYSTSNLSAAQTTRTDKLWENGGLSLSLDGLGYSKLGEWDGGAVRVSHQEFTNFGTSRVTQSDDATALSNHATHVAGTIVAHGVTANAKGMAYNGNLKAYDWNFDEAEMATAAAAGLELSNHSYGFLSGWHYDGSEWIWYGVGSPVNGIRENWYFGFYDDYAANWDEIAYNAPNYLIVRAAGNDRGQGPSYASSTPDYPEKDGGLDGFDCIANMGVSKNILTVGAVYGVTSYTSPSDVVMTSFSCWGPADDGRIKPDIVAKGVSLYSTNSSADDSYGTNTGTSMATPNVTGTLALLQQHYQNLNSGTPMRSATLKSLIIHTADEAGDNIGPDYKFGWGLLNAERAAEKISNDFNEQNLIDEINLINDESYSRDVFVTGESPLRVTIAWTDVKGIPVELSLNPSDIMLVNDLDITITDSENNTFYPYKLDRDNPFGAATNSSKNSVDNVEMVFVENPTPGYYNISVTHDGNLSGGSQAFSIIISGVSEVTEIAWTGETSNDWADATNWDNGVPQIYNNVVIPSGLTNYPTVSDSRQCNDITLAEGTTLVGFENLQIIGEFSYSTLVSWDSEYHYLSSPVGQTMISAVFPEVNHNEICMYSYDEVSQNWIAQSISGDDNYFENGVGYNIHRMNGSTLSNYTLSFDKNSPIWEDKTFTNLSSTGSVANYSGWHLLGNPFPAALDWSNIALWNLNNIENAVYVWNGNSGNYIDYNGSLGGLTGGEIPVGQGFLVKVNSSTNSIKIPVSAAIHANRPIYKTQLSALRLDVTTLSTTFSDVTFVSFNDNASLNFDSQFDSRKLSGLGEAPQLYTTIDNQRFSINVLPKNSKVIALNFEAGIDDLYTINASEINLDVVVTLEDLKTGKMQILNKNMLYNFEANVGDPAERFLLHLKSMDTNNDFDEKSFSAYAINKTLYVDNFCSGELNIFNLNGELVYKKQVDKGLSSVPLNSGIYIVNISGFSQKVMVM